MIVDGIPAGCSVSGEVIKQDLARRRLGYGRGARMRIEADEFEILSGVFAGETIGSPIAIVIGNSEWLKWKEVFVKRDEHAGGEREGEGRVGDESVKGNCEREEGEREIGNTQFKGRFAPLVCPRPGHADLPGMQKYGFTDARPVLERASARETAARVAAGAVVRQVLRCFGIEVFSHVVSIGGVDARKMCTCNNPCYGNVLESEKLRQIDLDPVRCICPIASSVMVERVDEAKCRGETLGGVIQVVARGVPVGLGSYVQWDRRLDGKLAQNLMSIPAIKGVEIGAGFDLARRFGSDAHDEVYVGDDSEDGFSVYRKTNFSGGIDAGISTGEEISVMCAMKPLSTVPHSLATINTQTRTPARAHHQRSDICAVPAVGVVAEAAVLLTVCAEFLEKFSGDSLRSVRENYTAYIKSLKPQVVV